MDLSSVVPDRVPTPAKLFLFGMVLSGLGNGVFNVVLQLYLTSLGFDSATLGTIFMMNAVGATLLTIPAGVLADRYGKGKVILSGFSLGALALILMLAGKSVEVFMLGFLLIGVTSSTWVIMGPLYSSFFDSDEMDRAFGLMGFLSITASSVGSLLGFIPPMLVAHYRLSLQSSYWIVLVVAAVLFLGQAPFIMMSIRGAVEPEREGGFKFNLRSKEVVAKFCLINVINRIGYGVFFSLFPYYVNTKFGVKSDALGTLYFVSNFVTAGANVIAPRVSKRLGTLKTIAVAFGLCTPFYLMIPLAPNFMWLSALYVIRIGLANVSSPLASSLFMRLLYDDEKATANSITMMAANGGNTVAPWLGGRLMEQAYLDFPGYLGAGLYAVTATSYYFLLRNEKEKEVERAIIA